jgi:hypothetical protein
MRGVLLALLVAGSLACGHASAPPRASAGGVRHTVQAGETVWRLSKRYGVPIRTILRANGLDDVTQVPTGERAGHQQGQEDAPHAARRGSTD